MSRFIARRLVAMVPLLMLVSMLAFSLVLLLPGDPALAILGGVAIPNFFLGILLIYLFAVWLRILPPSGYVAPWENLGENLRLMLMPALAVGASLAAILMRQVRSALLEVLQQEYILTARSKG